MSWLSGRVAPIAKKILPIAAPVSALGTAGVLKAGGMGDPLGIMDPKIPNIAADPNGLSSSYLNYLKTSGAADPAFADLLKRYSGVSSVDQVQSGVDSDMMRNLLSGVDSDTAKTVGSLKSDFADRGLGGPGQISDIEAAGLGQARATGDVNRSAVRDDFATKELARLKGRETSLDSAYSDRYANAANTDKIVAQLLTGSMTGDLTKDELQQKYKTPSFFDKILSQINLGVKV